MTRCAEPQCREQIEIALDAILSVKADAEQHKVNFETLERIHDSEALDFQAADKALACYVLSWDAHKTALRAILETARDDIRGTRYLSLADFEKAMELVK